MKRKKTELIVTTVIIILVLIAGVSIFFSMTPKETGITWPENEYTALVPAPTEGSIKETDDIGNNTYSIYMYWSEQEAKDYGKALKEAGFDQTINEKGYNAMIVSGYILKVQNTDGVQVSVESSSLGKLGAIKITKP